MARRTNGEGCVVRTADGKWSARIQIGIQPNGKPKIKTFSGKTRKEAAERLNDYIIQLERMHGSKQNKITVCEGLLFWLETYKKIYLKPTSYDRLESTIQSNIIPYIGHIRVSELTASVIQGR